MEPVVLSWKEIAREVLLIYWNECYHHKVNVIGMESYF